MLCYFEIFTSCQGQIQKFLKHYSKCKTVSIKFKKILQERRLPILKFSQDNVQNNFLNFLTCKNIFITLQYSGDIFGTFLKQIFVECFSNILETLLCDNWNLPKDQHLLLSNHTLLTQNQLLHREHFKKSFPLKCSLNVPPRYPQHCNAEGTLSEYSRNIACRRVAKHGVTRKRSTKRLKQAGNLFRKKLQLAGGFSSRTDPSILHQQSQCYYTDQKKPVEFSEH